ncbi:TonB-dependent siderophore receptor [uncultured Oxalicibacterium sp.]|uniref:TonB-dependent siderophore receptor n=1 Tax=uncultured Oxalicibacterium sp. TaxID=1168540 RepID=UPI0025E8995C|nr:TonB-dependent siderophore receptor [uncultured Oxalicibacterium sp.]
MDTLPEIKVEAATLGETTEGTGSYTSGRSKSATPLSMSLRDTPQSVSVVTQQRIEDQRLLTVTDVLNNTTGVSVNQYETNRAQFNARGFKINNIMIDGVPTTWGQGWSSGEVMSSLAPYDRVEIVRGATGLMTGVGDPSAAINLVHKRAASKTFTGSADVGIGSWNQRRASADVSSSLNQAGTVRGRLVAEYEQKDSWIDLMKNKAQTVFGTIEADLTDNTLLTLGFSRQENNTKSPMWGGLPVWYSDGTRTNFDRSKTTSANWSRWDATYENYFAKLEHRFGNGWKIEGNYSYGERNGDSYLYYQSGFPNRATGLGLTANGGSYLTQTRQNDLSVNVSGPFALAGRTHELAAGYIYSEQKFNSYTRGYLPASSANFNTWNGGVPAPNWTAPTYYQDDTTKQQSLYGVARFSLADPIKLILGSRVTSYDKSGNAYYLAQPYQTIKVDHKVTPYAGLIYDINENFSAYASYTSIFQTQSETTVTGSYLKPVIGKSAEAGIKGEFIGGRLNGSLAVFHIKQDNLAQAAGTIAGRAYYTEANGATSDGFELDLAGELARGWNINVGYTQFEATKADGTDVNTVYPRKLFRVFTTYRLPGQWNGLTVGGGVNWQDATYAIATNPSGAKERFEQKAFSLVNLMARYDFSPKLSAQLNINNVFDKTYFGMAEAFGQLTYGEPRNATLSLRYRF